MRSLTHKELKFICDSNDNDGCAILVSYKKKVRVVADIHFGNDALCYLRNNAGVPVRISDCILSDKTEALINKAKKMRGWKQEFFISETFGPNSQNHIPITWPIC